MVWIRLTALMKYTVAALSPISCCATSSAIEMEPLPRAIGSSMYATPSIASPATIALPVPSTSAVLRAANAPNSELAPPTAKITPSTPGRKPSALTTYNM